MEIDFFTFIAQIINFAILIVILRKFLFGPLARAMDEREKKLADEMAQARQKNADAGELAEKSRALLKIQQEDAGKAIEAGRAVAEAEKQKLLEDGKKQADAAKRAWLEALALEKQRFLDGLLQRSGVFACALAGKALKDLADTELSGRVTDVFVARLKGMDDKNAGAFTEAVAGGGGRPVVRSAFELPAEAQAGIKDAIKARLGYAGGIVFETDLSAACGVELRMSGFRVSWTITDYLREMEEELDKVWEQR